jgi:V/A-type H+-transporting ATPase subunit A
VYLGMTLGEYYRDMGYRVAVMCDSLSRWAEALREIGSRLQEMPGEEGYPTYLGNRLGKLYERAGRVVVKGSPERVGAVTLIGSFSPPGGDFSEPVTQAAMRVIGGLWALDANLAHQRQFPAVNWETSYSLYTEATTPWFVEHVGADWPDLRRDTLELLQREAEVLDIAGLVGPETLQDGDRLVLDAARIVREVVLGQNAYDPNDAASPLAKTYQLAKLSQAVYKAAIKALENGAKYEDLDLRLATTAMASARYAPEEEFEMRVKQVEESIAAIAVPGQAVRKKVAV